MEVVAVEQRKRQCYAAFLIFFQVFVENEQFLA